MWFEGRVYFIDVSQSIEPSHPNGLEFLVRDCRNVSSFFTKCGVSGVMTAYELFNHLTGLDITADNHEEFLVKVSKGEQHTLLDCPSFVSFFELIRCERLLSQPQSVHSHALTLANTYCITDTMFSLGLL